MTFKKQRPSTILGLAFDGNRLDAVVLRRTNGHFQAVNTASAQLALSPLTGDPELVGREIRNVLEQAGIRERRCVVGLPLNWMLTLQVAIPEMPEEDIAGFLELEAERGFHGGPESISIARSICQIGNEKQATLIGAPRGNIETLDKVLRAAQLRPESFTIGVSALQDPGRSEGVVALSVGLGNVDLQISCGGGIAALRFLEGASESEGTQKRLDADVTARELRITLGQLPAGFQGAIKTLRIFGRGDLARRFVSDITPRAESMGLTIELIERCGRGWFENVTPAETLLSPTVALAAQFLIGAPNGLEYLPPRVSPWQRFVSSKVSGRRLGVTAAIVGGLVAIIGGAFVVQQIQIESLERKLSKIDPQIIVIEDAMKQTRTYRPWCDESFRTLSVLRKLTEAFPEDGRITAKTLEIREALVTCSGVAQNRDAVLRVTEKLRSTKGIGNVNVENLRGESPVNFTFNFQVGETANAN